jgi:hypothetical protein
MYHRRMANKSKQAVSGPATIRFQARQKRGHSVRGRKIIAKIGRCQFEKIFAGGPAGEPDGKTIGRIVARQKLHCKAC